MTTPNPEPKPPEKPVEKVPEPTPTPVAPAPVVKKEEPKPLEDEAARRESRRMTRRAFAVSGVAALAGYGSWRWLQTRSDSAGVPWPFRRVHELNEGLGRVLYSDKHLAPEFDQSRVGTIRVNGWHGWQESYARKTDWKIAVETPGLPVRKIGVEELAKLPRVESIFEFKCIEGWSAIAGWGGYRFADFLQTFGLVPSDPSLQYLLLSTPDGGYTAALDLPSAMHPQAILADRLNGEPLTDGHGAPIRLVLPVKYGVKNIKWLAKIEFMKDRPSDYWTGQGYDWYAGL